MPHSEEWKAKWKPPTFDERGMTPWMWRAIHPERLKIERGVDIGSFTLIQAEFGVSILEDSEVGSHCSIYSVNTEDGTRGQVLIGPRAKIGAHTTILPNVIVFPEATVGAYSLVKSDIPANSLAFGIPARIVRLLKSDEREA